MIYSDFNWFLCCVLKKYIPQAKTVNTAAVYIFTGNDQFY